jgi:hypothetical protein
MLSGGFGRRYVRGGAVFAGFARRLFRRWREWGSEQVASNYLIANSPEECVLPCPKYASLWPGVLYEQASFLHGLGTNRFKGGTCREIASRVVRELR